MRKRMTAGLLASVLALSIALAACDTNEPSDGDNATTTTAGLGTTAAG